MEMRDLRDGELARELHCRKLPCPSCGVAAGTRCDYGVDRNGKPWKGGPSHLGRYSAAVRAHLVPALRGVDHG